MSVKKYAIDPKIYLPLVVNMAKGIRRQYGYSIEMEDLVQEGFLGLMESLARYDEKQGASLKTFVTYRIKGSMQDFIRRQDFVPRSIRIKNKIISRHRKNLSQTLGREILLCELADYIGMLPNKLDMALSQPKKVMSIFENFDNKSLIELPDDKQLKPEEIIYKNQLHESFKKALLKLNTSERTVIILIYYSDLIQKAVAGILGITESRVNQIHKKALRKMEAYFCGKR